MKIRKVAGRSKPWMLDVGLVAGKRQRQFFKTKDLAEKEESAIEEMRRSVPVEVCSLSVAELMEAKEVKAFALRLGTTPMAALHYYEAHYIKMEKQTLSDAIAACVEARKISGKVEEYYEGLRRSLEAFQRSLGADGGSVLCSQVTRAQIESWAHHEVALATTRGRLIDVRTFFSFCEKRHWIVRSPTKGIEPIKLIDKAPGIMTVENLKLFLDTILKNKPAILGYICPIIFGGLRPIESQKLTTAQVGAELVEVTPKMSKTRKRRFVPINETLAAWLAVPGVKFGKSKRSRQVDTCRWIAGGRKMIGKKRDIAAFPWSHDILRHSFCSYGLEKYGAKDTAAWAGHSEQILFAHYRERVLPVEAERFWNLRPEK